MYIIFTAFSLLVATLVILYNRLVRDRNRCESAWSDIDVQLQRRHDLVPLLVKAVDQYADYERASLEAVTSLRSQARTLPSGSVEQRGLLEQQLGESLLRIIAVAEQYPDLKANENFLSLQRDLVDTENYLQSARRFYNGAVRHYNTRVESFPANLVAGTFRFVAQEYFQKSGDDVADAPRVNLGNTP